MDNIAISNAAHGVSSTIMNSSNPGKLSGPAPLQTYHAPSPESKKQEMDEQELNIFVADLLDQMTSKFEQMGNSILHRIDTMGDRIDNLEKSIGDLMASQGVEGLHHDAGDNAEKSTKISSFTSNERSAEF